MEVERDPISGETTTGHEWDGLKELNTPVPSASKWAMRIVIIYTLAYTVMRSPCRVLPRLVTLQTRECRNRLR